MAEANSEKDLTDVLKNIREQMSKRQELRAQKETNQELKKLNVNLASNRNNQPDIKFPSAEDITRTFIKSSPIFSRAFSGWIKDTASYTQASNDELVQIHKDLTRDVSSPTNDDELEYLNLISDQLKLVGEEYKDGNEKILLRLVSIDDRMSKLVDGVMFDGNDSLKQFIRLGAIDDSINNMNVDLIAAGDSYYTKSLLASEKQLKATKDIETKIGNSIGHVVGQLVRMRDDNIRSNEQLLMRMNEHAKDDKNNGLPKATSVVPTDPTPDAGGSGAGGFLAGAGALAALAFMKKVLFAPLKLIRGLTGIFTSMGGITKLLKGVGRMIRIGPLALITAAIDFGKGFFNAKEILGKTDVTILDRVKAGISELLGGFGDLFDWVAKLFGFDTNIGKSIREGFLNIAKKPFEIAQSVVDWFKNDLFAGIDMNTSLTDIPGIIADNLQKQIIKLVDYVKETLSTFFDDAVATMSVWVEELKKGFNDQIKKPFYRMVNSILESVFNVIDKFIDLIPDALGGEAARKKMEDARKDWKLEDGPKPLEVTVYDNDPWVSPKPKTEMTEPERDTQTEDKQNSISAPQRDITLPTQAATVGPLEPAEITPMQAVTPMYGKAAMNTQDIKTSQQQAPVIHMPVNNVKNNVNNAKNTTILNSPSLQPSNDADTGRMLWDR